MFVFRGSRLHRNLLKILFYNRAGIKEKHNPGWVMSISPALVFKEMKAFCEAVKAPRPRGPVPALSEVTGVLRAAR